MLGAGMSMLGYYLLSLIFLIWMVVKIARGGALMAVLCFCFPLLAIFPLLRNWGDPDTDIRVPFFGLWLSLGLSMFMAFRAVDKAIEESALYWSEEELALIAEENPEMAAEILAARQAAQARGELPAAGPGWAGAEATGDEGWPEAEQAERGPRFDPNALPPATQRARQRAAAPLPDAPEAFQPGPLRQHAARIGWRFGSAAFPEAHAQLQIPKGFRFAPRFVVTQVARLRGTPLEPVSLGWLVHREIDLAQLDAWYVEVFFIEAGHFALARHDPTLPEQLVALSGQPLADGSGRSLGTEAYAPTWIAEHGVLSWAVIRGDPEADHRADLLAAKPLRHGVLLYVMRELSPQHKELGLRATRLMALRSRAEPQWGHADYRARRDPAAPLGLIDWVRGVPWPRR
jgi:hypothetical protein